VKFSELLIETIENAEIPLRFEPGAAEAVARPVIETLKAWVAAHDPNAAKSDFEFGQKALVVQLLEELDDHIDLAVEDVG
jgi:NAD(P)H-dependent FMN reductase